MIMFKFTNLFENTLLLSIFCFFISFILFFYSVNDLLIDFNTLNMNMTFQPPLLFLSIISFFIGIYFIIKTDFGFAP